MVVGSSSANVHAMQCNLAIFASRRCRGTFEHAGEEVIDRLSSMDVIHPDDREWVKEDMEKRPTGRPDNAGHEFRAIRRDGKVITVKIFEGFLIERVKPAIVGTVAI
jgi:PAS domain S-box-containing protein